MDRRYLLIAVGALVVANVFVWRATPTQSVFQLEILRVAKGEAFLLRAPGGATMLIDTGPDASILRELGAALPPWQRRIDVFIVTSSDKNYSGAALSVLERYHVLHYLTPNTLLRGARITLGRGVVVDALSPDRPLASGNANTRAVALRISYGTNAVVIDGGLSKRAASWYESLDAGLPHAELTLSSTTPSGAYSLDGQSITKIR